MTDQTAQHVLNARALSGAATAIMEEMATAVETREAESFDGIQAQERQKFGVASCLANAQVEATLALVSAVQELTATVAGGATKKEEKQ